MNTMTVGVAPHIKCRNDTQRLMLDVIIALIPALLAAVIIFGLRALLLTCISAAACVLCEYLWEKLMDKPITIGDLSAVVTGILLAYNVPAGLPVWQLIIGDIVAIIGVKMLFGGLGCNFMNPALVGRIVIMFSFTTDMTEYMLPRTANALVSSVDAVSTATPLAMMEQLDWSDFMGLFLGNHSGTIGEVCAAALLLGGVYLCLRKVIKPIIPLCFLGSTALFSWLFGGTQPILSLFAGGLLLGSIFMATDYVTSPYTNKGMAVFGLGCGFITSAIRVFGSYAEGATFAILLMNILVPYINDLTMTKPLGGAAKT